MKKKAKKLFAALLMVVTVLTLTACKANYEWTTDKLPKPNSLKGHVTDGGDGSFSATIECSAEYFQKYIDECISSGFNAEIYYASNGAVKLFNSDGSTVSLFYVDIDYGDQRPSMCVELAPPITLGNAEWADSTAAAQIPKPGSDLFGQTRGHNDDKVFRVYVGNTPHDDFLDYVSRCREAGFTDITTDDDVYFEASNGKFLLYLSYESVNVMCVSVLPK